MYRDTASMNHNTQIVLDHCVIMTGDRREPLTSLPGPPAQLQPVELRAHDNEQFRHALTQAQQFNQIYNQIVQRYSDGDRSDQALAQARLEERQAWDAIMVPIGA